MTPNCRHLVFTVTNSAVAGVHLYSHTQLLRSFCGFVTAKFATWEISNASHDCFLSIFQSAASFWAPGFTHDHKLEDDHPSKL